LCASFRLLLRPRRAFLLRLREGLEAAFLLEARDALGAGLEVEPQRALDGNLAKAEVRRGETPTDHDLFFLAFLRDRARVAAREERRPVPDDRDARAAFLRIVGVRKHLKQEEELAVADAREPRGEASRRAPFVLSTHGVLVALPVLAIGRIRDQVVEAGTGVA